MTASNLAAMDGTMHHANGKTERERKRERVESTWSERKVAPNRWDCGGRRDRR